LAEKPQAVWQSGLGLGLTVTTGMGAGMWWETKLEESQAEWDVDFKLHLQGGVVLTGTVKDGKLVTWDITPKARKAGVVVCGPAPSTVGVAAGNADK